jgi:hypothetical protein
MTMKPSVARLLNSRSSSVPSLEDLLCEDPQTQEIEQAAVAAAQKIMREMRKELREKNHPKDA